jgi:hypothetical protein
VRYRMRQLELSLGDLLHDPRQRFELELVLRAAAPMPHQPARRRAVAADVVLPAPRNRR